MKKHIDTQTLEITPTRKVGIKTIEKEGDPLYKDYVRIEKEVFDEEYICPCCGGKASKTSLYCLPLRGYCNKYCCEECGAEYSIYDDDKRAEVERRFAEFKASKEVEK